MQAKPPDLHREQAAPNRSLARGKAIGGPFVHAGHFCQFVNLAMGCAFALLLVVFAVQLWGVQPRLDARTVRILAGEALPGSHLHSAYVVLELIKISLLLSIGWRALRSAGR